MAMTLELTDRGYKFSGQSKNFTNEKNALLKPYGKQILNHGKELLLLPDKDQAMLINKTVGCSRCIRNDYLDRRIDLYKTEKRTLTLYLFQCRIFLCIVDNHLQNTFEANDR